MLLHFFYFYITRHTNIDDVIDIALQVNMALKGQFMFPKFSLKFRSYQHPKNWFDSEMYISII